eukprot:3129387-Rhodomonas_salina.1
MYCLNYGLASTSGQKYLQNVNNFRNAKGLSVDVNNTRVFHQDGFLGHRPHENDYGSIMNPNSPGLHDCNNSGMYKPPSPGYRQKNGNLNVKVQRPAQTPHPRGSRQSSPPRSRVGSATSSSSHVRTTYVLPHGVRDTQENKSVAVAAESPLLKGR